MSETALVAAQVVIVFLFIVAAIRMYYVGAKYGYSQGYADRAKQAQQHFKERNFRDILIGCEYGYKGAESGKSYQLVMRDLKMLLDDEGYNIPRDLGYNGIAFCPDCLHETFGHNINKTLGHNGCKRCMCNREFGDSGYPTEN
jgi:hypothetical protein